MLLSAGLPCGRLKVQAANHTNTQGRKIIEENVLPSLILPNMIRDLVFSNKDEKP